MNAQQNNTEKNCINEQFIYSLYKNIKKKYITAAMCLIMLGIVSLIFGGRIL